MNNSTERLNAEVVSVFPDKIKIKVDDLNDFRQSESLKVGSYLKVSDNENAKLMSIIENFSIEVDDHGERTHIIEAYPLGMIVDGKFERGGDSIAIPPKKVEPASVDEIRKIYTESLKEEVKFEFSELSTNSDIRVPIDGNKFFNKHIAVVGSTGSGKSHTLSTIIQKAVDEKNGEYNLNNSHIVIFDIHSEYKAAFPDSNHIDINNLVLPYWLLNSDELEEILLESGERDNYNQSSIFRKLVTLNKKHHNPKAKKIFYDTPTFFDIHEVQNAIVNLNNETVNYSNPSRYMINDGSYKLNDGKTDFDSGIELINNDERLKKYFSEQFEFFPVKRSNISKGNYADGTLEKFSNRFDSKINQKRLEFLFGKRSKKITFEETLRYLLGYDKDKESNVTVIDLSGIPFEVLSITVSLISRLIFEYGYFYKRLRTKNDSEEKINNDVPILMVYEEAHKYVPNSELTKYRASKTSIERIAKEGRKYGVTLMLSSQRPSEISETIFSQCNNFIAMRLTNPNDQNYVKKLLPDTLGSLINKMPSLRAGEALLIGEAITLPSIVQIDECQSPPSSNDIPYLEIWKEEWKDLDFQNILKEWHK